MTWPVGILAVLAVVGGWLQVAGVWHPFGEWLDPVAFGREHLALVEPTVTQDYVTSALAVGLGLLGMYVAWTLYGARSRPVPRNAGVQDALEHKLWFDELYDLIFYKPAVLLTRGLRRGVEEPLIGGSISASRSARARRPASSARRRPATCAATPSRSPSASRSSSSSSSASNDDRADRPPARRRARRCCRSRPRRRRARAPRRARGGRRSGRSRSASSTSRRASSSRTTRAGSATSASPITSASTASRSSSPA